VFEMSVFHGLSDGKTWQVPIIATPEAPLAEGLGVDVGVAVAPGPCVGVAVGRGFPPPDGVPPPPLQAQTKQAKKNVQYRDRMR
jgi:hypothetical protein